MRQPASVLLNRLLARGRLRHMQVLVRLAELGSVRRTAEAIGLTQPRVTQMLADLEAMMDTPLFHRHARGVRPTASCADLLPMARQILLGTAAGAEAIAARQGSAEGVVRVSGSTAGINGLLVQALPAFNDAHPAVQVQLRQGDDDELLLAIGRGQVDIACCRRRAVIPQGWGFEPLLQDRFVIACAIDHPLMRRRQLDWPDLAEETWLPAPSGSAAREYFDAINLRFDGGLRTCEVITRVPDATWRLLRHRPMLTVVPYGVVRHLVEARELAVLKMKASMPLEPIGMLLPLEDAGAATLRLADFLRHFAARASKPKKLADERRR